MSRPWILSPDADSATAAAALEAHGVAIVPRALSATEHAAIYAQLEPPFAAAQFSQGLFYGQRTKRFGRVLSRAEATQGLALHDLAAGTAQAVLGPHCQNIQLNLTQAIEIWPGSFAQVPHRDQDIWMGASRVGELMVNAMWALDDFTDQNGATRVWPGSHRSDDPLPAGPGIAVEMPRGSLCLFLGSTLHGGGPNESARPRRGLVMSYCLGWLKPCENPWLSYPPDIARTFAPELAHLIGYRQDPPSLNNVDGRCPSELLKTDAGQAPFAEQLTDEQTALIEQFNRQQAVPRTVPA